MLKMYSLFEKTILEKTEAMSFNECIDTALFLCMRDFHIYAEYTETNNVPADTFEKCEKTFTELLINRRNLYKLDCKTHTDSLNSLLEELEEQDGDYFNECVNVTCEIMNIIEFVHTGDKRRIVSVFKLCFENAEAFLQKSGCTGNDYDKLISDVMLTLMRVDFSSAEKIFDYLK